MTTFQKIIIFILVVFGVIAFLFWRRDVEVNRCLKLVPQFTSAESFQKTKCYDPLKKEIFK